MRRRIARQHKLEGEERKSSRQLNRNSLVCFFELSGVLYLYRDFVTVLAKNAATVTLMDKIKRNKSTKVDETN
jgi:hypothetical protein